MPHRFSFDVDPSRDLVRIVLTGLFLPIHVSDFFAARKEAHAQLTCAPGQHVTLTDLSALETVPQETADAFTMLLTHPLSRARRLAFVVGATLVRGQLIRVLAGREGRFFTDCATAEAWLTEGGSRPQIEPLLPAKAAPDAAVPDRGKLRIAIS